MAPKNKGGRPKLQIDEKLIYELAKIQCTMKEISACVKCSVDTLENRFSDLINEAKEEGKSSLRRMQYKKAMEGNTAMLIWLGKHILQQKETLELTTHETDVMQLLKRWEKEGSKGIVHRGWSNKNDAANAGTGDDTKTTG